MAFHFREEKKKETKWKPFTWKMLSLKGQKQK
jgi:hypothetical protein